MHYPLLDDSRISSFCDIQTTTWKNWSRILWSSLRHLLMSLVMAQKDGIGVDESSSLSTRNDAIFIVLDVLPLPSRPTKMTSPCEGWLSTRCWMNNANSIILNKNNIFLAVSGQQGRKTSCCLSKCDRILRIKCAHPFPGLGDGKAGKVCYSSSIGFLLMLVKLFVILLASLLGWNAMWVLHEQIWIFLGF